MKHELKIWPQYFERVLDGTKTFELRENDRGFQPGDTVELCEWDPTKEERFVHGYTGRKLQFRIGYILPIDATRVVFSLLSFS